MSYESYFNSLKAGDVAMSEAEFNACLAPTVNDVTAKPLTVFVMAHNVNGGELSNLPIMCDPSNANAVFVAAVAAYYQNVVDEDEQENGMFEHTEKWREDDCMIAGLADGHITAVTGCGLSLDDFPRYLGHKRAAIRAYVSELVLRTGGKFDLQLVRRGGAYFIKAGGVAGSPIVDATQALVMFEIELGKRIEAAR